MSTEASIIEKQIEIDNHKSKCVTLNNEFPNDYLIKPIKSNGMEYNSIIIFDWDDTLFSTSFLKKIGAFNNSFSNSKKIFAKIKKLEKKVEKVLSLSIEKGYTFIITNSDEGWVQESSRIFYPQVFPLLHKISILSSRKLFQHIYPNDSSKWKTETFRQISNYFKRDIKTKIICIGDSFSEIEASKKMANYFAQAYVKTVKFKTDPDISCLISQVNLLLSQFEKIDKADKNWRITVEKIKDNFGKCK